jgi:hypothetical protein
MSRFLLLLPLLMCVSLALGCGGGNNHQLQAIQVTPAIADAQDFPNGLVQFTATGSFNHPPTSIKPLPVLWSIGPWFNVPQFNDVSIDSGGVAQCRLGFVGTVEVWASAPADPAVSLARMNPFRDKIVVGKAQLTCP